jgi:hypothetical protein
VNNYDIAVFRTLWDSFKKIEGAWKPLLGAAFLMFVLQYVLVDLPENLVASTKIESVDNNCWALNEEAKKKCDAAINEYVAKPEPTSKAGDTPKNLWLFLASLLISIFIMLPLNAGLWMLGVKWVGEQQVRTLDIFRYWRLRYIGKLFLLMLWFVIRVGLPILLVLALLTMGIFFGLGSEKFLHLLNTTEALWALLITIPWWGIVVPSVLFAIIMAYLIFPYFFAAPLVLTKKMSVWQAITLAGQVFRKHGLKILLVFFIQSVVIGLCVFSLFLLLVAFLSNTVAVSIILGLIGVLLMPWYITLYGVVYHKMFENNKEAIDVRS